MRIPRSIRRKPTSISSPLIKTLWTDPCWSPLQIAYWTLDDHLTATIQKNLRNLILSFTLELPVLQAWDGYQRTYLHWASHAQTQSYRQWFCRRKHEEKVQENCWTYLKNRTANGRPSTKYIIVSNRGRKNRRYRNPKQQNDSGWVH